MTHFMRRIKGIVRVWHNAVRLGEVVKIRRILSGNKSPRYGNNILVQPFYFPAPI